MYGFWKNKRIVLYDTLLSEEMNVLLAKIEAEEKGSKNLDKEEKTTEEITTEEKVIFKSLFF